MRMGYKFKGYDWTELAEAFQVDIPGYVTDSRDKQPHPLVEDYISTDDYTPINPICIFVETNYSLYKIREILDEALITEPSDLLRKQVVTLCRRFVESIINWEIQNKLYLCPEARMLQKIDDDWTFLQTLNTVLTSLWT